MSLPARRNLGALWLAATWISCVDAGDRAASAPAVPLAPAAAAFDFSADPAIEGALQDTRRLIAEQTAVALNAAHTRATEALALSRNAQDRTGEGAALNLLANIHLERSERQAAMEIYRTAIPIWQALGDAENEGYSQSGLGLLYWSLGEPDTALRYLDAALTLQRRAGNGLGESIALYMIAMVYEELGAPEQALAHYRQTLALCLAANCDEKYQANPLAGMGKAYLAMGDSLRAAEHLERALGYARKGEDRGVEAMVAHALGGLQAGRGELGAARASFERALAIWRASEAREQSGYALLGLAEVDLAEQRLPAAEAHVEAALELIESERTQVAGAELRSSYLARRRKFYERAIEVLMTRHRQSPGAGFDQRAFAIAERARARGLLEMLVESASDIRHGVEPRLLARERELRRALVTSAEPDRARILDELREVGAEIRAHSPHYTALRATEPLPLGVIQRELLDGESLLLSYALGERRSFLWLVSRAGFESFELPPRATIEASARRAYRLLLQSHRRAARQATERALADLSAMVLGPVADRLGDRRLLIASDGSLQYVPFAALPIPGTGSGAHGALPLIARHEIVSVSSASVVALLRHETGSRAPAAKLLAVVSDPVFEAADPRLGVHAAPPSPGALPPPREVDGDLIRSLAEAGVARLDRLPYSRQEAEGILALAAPTESFAALDFAASRNTVISGRLASYRWLHFATHGLLNSAHPELSGLVLSMVDERGNAQDGFLRLQDLYDLDLSADLVVLSACQTALGKEVWGEGLVGLTRGFHYAGVPRVVASLWSVRDRATAELMQRFYAALLRDGLTPAAALRQAQVSMWHEARWEAPHHWAGFVLQGEWR